MTGHKLTERVDAADRGSEWYVVRAATRQERKAEERLVERGLSVYVPRMASLRLLRRQNKRERVEIPLFEGYMFAGRLPKDLPLSQLPKIEGVCGAVRFSRDRPSPVPFQMIELILQGELDGTLDRTRANEIEPLKPGEWVMLLDGPFAGFPASVVKLSKRDRVALLVSIFGRVTPVTMKTSDVERVA